MASTRNTLGYPAPWQKFHGPPVVPQDYMLPPIKAGMRAIRTEITKPADTNMPVYSTDTPDIIWKIPSTQRAFLDFRRSTIHATITVSGNAGTWAPSNYIWNCIDRVQVVQGGKLLEDRRYYGLQETLMHVYGSKWGVLSTVAPALWGYGNQTLRTAHATSWKYQIPFTCESLTKGLMPWFKTDATGSFIGPIPEVEITWSIAPASLWIEAVTGGGTTPTWTINRWDISYEEISFEVGWAGFLKEWKTFAGPVAQVLFQTVITRIFDLTTSTEQNIQIDHRAQSIIGVMATFRYAGQTNNVNVVNKFETYLGPATTNLDSYQWEINNADWPMNYIYVTDTYCTEAQVWLLRFLEQYHSRAVMDDPWTISPIDFATNKFCMVLDAKAHPFNTHLLNPVSTAGSNTNIVLKMRFNTTTGAAAGLQVVTHVFYHTIWNYSNISGVLIEY
jgi:hypothetical protein